MEIKNIKVDKMRYQTNSISYLLVILSIIFSLLALFALITYDAYGEGENPLRVVPDFRIGLEISVGIILLLMSFFAAEKVRYYDKFWSYYGVFILAGINFLRIFNIPPYAFEQGWIPENIRLFSVIAFLLAAISLTIAGVLATRKVYLIKKHVRELENHGDITV